MRSAINKDTSPQQFSKSFATEVGRELLFPERGAPRNVPADFEASLVSASIRTNKNRSEEGAPPAGEGKAARSITISTGWVGGPRYTRELSNREPGDVVEETSRGRSARPGPLII